MMEKSSQTNVFPTREQIIGARGMLGLSAKRLASEAGIGHATMERIENAKAGHIPNDETIVKIKSALERLGIVFTKHGIELRNGE